MDNIVNFYFGNSESNERVLFPEFVYDDKRVVSKIYVIYRLIGLIFYSMTLTTCYNIEFYIGIIISMFLSTINNVRYEYAHMKIYGTIFPSIAEYDTWKRNQYPNSRIFFSAIEFIIEIIYFIKIFPPHLEFYNLCKIGEGTLKINIILLFTIYIILTVFSLCILLSMCFYTNQNQNPIRESNQNSLQIPIILNTNQTDECCICLDTDNTRAWSILPCSHKFHHSCVSTWLISHRTCPICRLHLMRVI